MDGGLKPHRMLCGAKLSGHLKKLEFGFLQGALDILSQTLNTAGNILWVSRLLCQLVLSVPVLGVAVGRWNEQKLLFFQFAGFLLQI